MAVNPYLAVAIVAATASLTWLVRQAAVRWNLYDLPVDRSSHVLPTPRVGGIAIAIGTLAGWMLARETAPLWTSVWAGGLVIALVGIVDDLKTLSPPVKLAGEILALAGPLWALGTLPSAMPLIFVAASGVFALSYINFFNFMDGTDGLAGSVAVIAALGLSMLAFQAGASQPAYSLQILALATLGFLLFNWSPASVFMGDTGSLFIGYALSICVIAAYGAGVALLPAMFVLSPFLFDTVLTMMRRLRNGEVIWRAHRTHLYQRLVRSGGTHRQIALLYSAWTMFEVLIGWAWLGASPQWRPLLAVAAILPGIALVRYVGHRELRASGAR